MKPPAKALVTLAKFAVSIGILVLLLRSQDLSSLKADLLAVKLDMLALAVLLLFAQTFVLCHRWILILRASDACPWIGWQAGAFSSSEPFSIRCCPRAATRFAIWMLRRHGVNGRKRSAASWPIASRPAGSRSSSSWQECRSCSRAYGESSLLGASSASLVASVLRHNRRPGHAGSVAAPRNRCPARSGVVHSRDARSGLRCSRLKADEHVDRVRRAIIHPDHGRSLLCPRDRTWKPSSPRSTHSFLSRLSSCRPQSRSRSEDGACGRCDGCRARPRRGSHPTRRSRYRSCWALAPWIARTVRRPGMAGRAGSAPTSAPTRLGPLPNRAGTAPI